jgi:hypothetical protein
MSAKTIYTSIQFHMKGELKKIALGDLRQKGKKRAQECGAGIRKRAKPGGKPVK